MNKYELENAKETIKQLVKYGIARDALNIHNTMYKIGKQHAIFNSGTGCLHVFDFTDADEFGVYGEIIINGTNTSITRKTCTGTMETALESIYGSHGYWLSSEPYNAGTPIDILILNPHDVELFDATVVDLIKMKLSRARSGDFKPVATMIDLK